MRVLGVTWYSWRASQLLMWTQPPNEGVQLVSGATKTYLWPQIPALEVFFQLQMLLESAIGCDLHERIFDSSFYPFFLSCMTHPYAAADDDALWIFLFPRIQKEFAPKGPEALLLPFSRHVALDLRHVGKQNLDTWWHLQSWTMGGFLNRVNAKVDNFDRSQNMFSRCSGKTLTKMAVALCSLAKLREVVENCSRNQLTRCAIQRLKCLIIPR